MNELEEKVITAYHGGEKIEAILNVNNISGYQLSKILRANNVPFRRNQPNRIKPTSAVHIDGQRLPDLPAWSEAWTEPVQVAWLESWQILAQKGGERA
jgi:hypothetical protein